MGKPTAYDFRTIRRLVGEVSEEQLRHVDCFTGRSMGIFMPAGGACFYALTPEHTHPAYLFVVPFNDRGTVVIGGRPVTPEPGKIQALSPDIPHHELPADLPPRYLALIIGRELFEGELAHYRPDGELRFTGELYPYGPELLPLLRAFMQEADNTLPGREGVLAGIEMQLCHLVIRTVLAVSSGLDRVSRRLEIDRVIEHLHAHLGE